jgi:AcrR family transcriptional regulator
LKISESAETRPRWVRRKEARPAELLAAALDLFVERGFAGTRLDDVAARAGVSKGTLYLYFENKEELFKAVVRENIVERISAARDEVSTFAGSSAELLKALTHRWWKEFGATQAGGISKLMMAESGNFPEITRFFLEEVIEPWHRLIAAVLERGIARGEFTSVHIETFVHVFSAPMVMLSLWKRSFGPCSSKPVDADRCIETLLDMALASLQAGVTAPAAGRKVRRRPLAR